MNSLHLHTHPDSVLRTPAQPVVKKNKAVRQLLEDMLEAMRTWGGIGLAAPQAGISQRLITAEVEHERLALINPVILEGQGGAQMDEGCLSVPGVNVRIKRHTSIWVRAYDDERRVREFKCEGLLARVIQHEIDHLDGILILDHGPGVPRGTL